MKRRITFKEQKSSLKRLLKAGRNAPRLSTSDDEDEETFGFLEALGDVGRRVRASLSAGVPASSALDQAAVLHPIMRDGTPEQQAFHRAYCRIATGRIQAIPADGSSPHASIRNWMQGALEKTKDPYERQILRNMLAGREAYRLPRDQQSGARQGVDVTSGNQPDFVRAWEIGNRPGVTRDELKSFNKGAQERNLSALERENASNPRIAKPHFAP